MKKTTAVITAATGQTGLAIAHDLAKAGYDLILVDQSLSDLTISVNELSSRYGISVEAVVCNGDESNSPLAVAGRIRKAGRDVSVFVNERGQPVFGSNLEMLLNSEKIFVRK
ncbi:MAG TPA: SDR family NAD(P)-dependent oxidoreductase [Flavobacterium sp.]|jgi:short-subunit dehydrogenase